MKPHPWLQVARLLLAATFVVAGALKLNDPEAFAASVATFRVLPREWSNVVAIWLPPFEILCGTLLFARPWRRAAALGTTLLAAVFIVLLTQGMIRGLNMDCGCFGKWDPASGRPLVAILRDLLLLALGFFCYAKFRDQPGEERGTN